MEESSVQDIRVSSTAFDYNQPIPAVYSCDGKGINPPLTIKQLPEGTQTLAIIAEDPDAPGGTFDHWVAWNIEPTQHIREDSEPGISGINGKGNKGFHPPCPPDGKHRYYFHVYALNVSIGLPEGSGKEALREMMEPHIIGKGTLMGTYIKKEMAEH